MDKFNSMPDNKFSAFEATDVCRNFQTTSSKPSFYFIFITIMNMFLDILDFDLANKHLIQFMLDPLQRTGTHLLGETF